MGNDDEKIIAKPFLKWAGGKSQLISAIESRFPKEINRKTPLKKYFEPFIGGGALFFYIISNYNVKKAFISDINEDLILAYKVIKQYPEELIIELDKLIKNWPKSQKDKEEVYYPLRDKFNTVKTNLDYKIYSRDFSDNHIVQAARLIFLNKTCFNGIYRVNSKGEFNVPIGRYKKPLFYDTNNLMNISEYLQKTEIYNESYDFFKDMIDKNSLVYLDPPYRPITETSFTSYTKSNFNDNDQIKLAKFFRTISKTGAKIILSNSDPFNRDEKDYFFDDLYRGFRIDRIPAKRYINRDGNNRGPINEILVRNYGYDISNIGFKDNKLF